MIRIATVARARIVSLVPSLTETLFDYGLGDRIVGRTRFCIEPRGRVEHVEAVGGTKNPDVDRIIRLEPDLVVVNKEENRIEDYERLRQAGLDVWVSHPRTVEEAGEMLAELGRVAGAVGAGEELASRVRRSAAAVRASPPYFADRAARVFCPIWRNPWMTFGSRTYICDVLRTVGLENVFAAADSADFFAIDLSAALAHGPDLILLPDEPYAFATKHAEELCAYGFSAPIAALDGRDLSWYGPRLPVALKRLNRLCSQIFGTSAA